MPLYEYKCHSCGKTIEVIQKFSDLPLTAHAECGGDLEKLISRSAFQLKGSGWYATDYAKATNGGNPKTDDSKSGEQKADSTKPESSGTSNGKATESKPVESKPAPAAASVDAK